MTITLTPSPATGSVQLSISTAAQVTRVQRTDRNGTYDLRVQAGRLPYQAGLTVQRRNLCTNPGAEVSTAGWSGNAATVTRDTTWYSSGTASFKVTPTGTGGTGSDMRAGSTSTFPFGMAPGKTYTLSAAMRLAAPQAVATPDARARRIVLYYSTNGTSFTSVSGAQLPNVAGQATARATCTITIPANATGALVLLGCGSDQAADAIWWDQILLEEGAQAGVPFNGDTPDTVDGTYAWDGPAGLSASTYSVPADALVLDDYEANGTLTYTVDTAAGTLTAAGQLALDTPWLGVPVMPQLSAQVETITGYKAGVATKSTVVEPDGRRDPVVIIRGASTRRGTLGIWAGESYQDARALLSLVQRGQVIMLRQAEHAGADMFFMPLGADLDTLAEDGQATIWGVSIEYVEVSRPPGDLAGALGWTWGALRDSYSTWGEVFAAYATWADLRIDRTK